MATYYTETFDSFTAGASLSGWVGISNGSAASDFVVNTRDAISGANAFAPTAGANTDNAVKTTGITAIADMAVQNTVKWRITGGNSIIAPAVRCQPAAGNAYVFLVSATVVYPYKFVAGSLGSYGTGNGVPGSAAGQTFIDGDIVSIKVECVGTTVRCRFWKSSTTEPTTWDVTNTDTSITGVGYPGLLMTHQSTPAAIGSSDNFFFGDPGTTFSLITTTSVAVNATGVTYSPYNWYLNGSTYAQSNYSGSYVKFSFTGTSLGMNVAQAATGTQYIRWSIDNQTYQTALVANGSTLFSLATGLVAGTHQVKLYCKGYGTTDRWTAPQPPESLRITSYVIDQTAAISAPPVIQSNTIVVFGDSIVEGYAADRTTTGPASNDAVFNWVPAVGEALNAEIGAVGLGGQGYGTAGVANTGNGGGNVPPFNTAYQYYFGTQSRLTAGVLSPAPTYVLLEHGVNGSYQQADVVAALTNLRTIAPTSILIQMAPFGGQNNTLLLGYFNAYKAANPSDTNCFFIDLGSTIADGLRGSGFQVGPDGGTKAAADGLHPSTVWAGRLAAALTSAIVTVTQPTTAQIAAAVWSRSQRTTTA